MLSYKGVRVLLRCDATNISNKKMVTRRGSGPSMLESRFLIFFILDK